MAGPRTEEDTARAAVSWLALRERADASVRSEELLEEALSLAAPDRVVVHDLGAGTGSMARWVAARTDRSQHWVLHDRDPEPLRQALADPPRAAAGTVTVEVRHEDVLSLPSAALAGADLVTASALLDMLTASELDQLVELCTMPGCPVLIALSVTGEVELSPHHPLDRDVQDAFNAHQRRRLGNGERLLGPDAGRAAVARFRELGHQVTTRCTPWRLGPADGALVAAWFEGWVGAAVEQRPGLAGVLGDYVEDRRAAADAGALAVVVGHTDLLAVRPRPPTPLR